MKLPNRQKAYIPKEKLINYLFSESHPVGSSKARFFREIGFGLASIHEFTEALLKIVKKEEVREERKSIYGINYVIDGKIQNPSGKMITVTTVWFIDLDENKPRFVTAYPV